MSCREFLLVSGVTTTTPRSAGGTADQPSQRAAVVKKLVVIVDDDPAIVNIYKRLITTKLPDCKIIGTFPNGMDAIDFLFGQTSGERPAEETASHIVVLMDYQMPVMDGLVTARVMRSMRAREQLRIILVSGYEVRLEGAEGCFDAVMKKPFSMNELLYEISRL